MDSDSNSLGTGQLLCPSREIEFSGLFYFFHNGNRKRLADIEMFIEYSEAKN